MQAPLWASPCHSLTLASTTALLCNQVKMRSQENEIIFIIIISSSISIISIIIIIIINIIIIIIINHSALPAPLHCSVTKLRCAFKKMKLFWTFLWTFAMERSVTNLRGAQKKKRVFGIVLIQYDSL